MKTDSIFFQIFSTIPQLFFEILGEPTERGELYEFSSVEVKQTAFRIDGVFTPKPDSAENTVIFTEFQFQKDETLYERLFSEIMLYLAQNLEVVDWRAVVLYPRRSIEQSNLYRHRSLLQSSQFQAIYLDDFLGTPSDELGIQLMQLIVSPEQETQQYLDPLVEQLRGKTDPTDKAIIKLVSTIMLCKFPRLTREEIESMFTVSDLKHTRVYQDAVKEGIAQGLERERLLLQRMLTRKIGTLPTDALEQLQTLDFEELGDLGEALLDFEQLADLSNWLARHQNEEN